jgi:RimJ/RimL family protein N-acetyltransferase
VVLGIQAIDGPFIGVMGLHGISWPDGTATSGACIGNTNYHNKGCGTDAKMLLLEYAFQTLNLRKVCSTVFAFNRRSRSYNEKCGYVVEGVRQAHVFRNGAYHDEILMAVFRDKWLPLWEQWQRA